MEPPEGDRNLEAHANGIEHRPVGDRDVDATARLALELARGRRESDRHECHARNLSGGQCVGERPAVEPRRAEHLERCVGAAAHREIRELEHPDARVEEGLGQIPHVGRRVHPLQACGVECVGSLPALARHHRQVEIELQVGREHLRQFADRHPVAERDRMAANEGAAAVVHPRARDRHAVDRIRPVEHHEGLLVLGSGLHRLEHRGHIRVEPAADVLDVEHDRIDVGEHLRRGSLRLAVEALHRHARLLVLAVRHVGLVERAAGAVLGSEDRHELHAVGLGEQRGGPPPLAVEAGVVGDHRHPLSCELPEAVADEDVDAGEHGPVGGGLRHAPWPHDRTRRDGGDPRDQRIDEPLPLGMNAV